MAGIRRRYSMNVPGGTVVWIPNNAINQGSVSGNDDGSRPRGRGRPSGNDDGSRPRGRGRPSGNDDGTRRRRSSKKTAKRKAKSLSPQGGKKKKTSKRKTKSASLNRKNKITYIKKTKSYDNRNKKTNFNNILTKLFKNINKTMSKSKSTSKTK